MTDEERLYFVERFGIKYYKTHSDEKYEYGYYICPFYDEEKGIWTEKLQLYRFQEKPVRAS